MMFHIVFTYQFHIVLFKISFTDLKYERYETVFIQRFGDKAFFVQPFVYPETAVLVYRYVGYAKLFLKYSYGKRIVICMYVVVLLTYVPECLSGGELLDLTVVYEDIVGTKMRELR